MNKIEEELFELIMKSLIFHKYFITYFNPTYPAEMRYMIPYRDLVGFGFKIHDKEFCGSFVIMFQTTTTAATVAIYKDYQLQYMTEQEKKEKLDDIKLATTNIEKRLFIMLAKHASDAIGGRQIS